VDICNKIFVSASILTKVFQGKMKKLFSQLSVFFFFALFVSCDSGSKRANSYYYAEEGIDSYKLNSDTIVNLQNIEEIKGFIKGKTFVSKGNKMIFDDSLNVTFYYNGKPEPTLECEVQEYILKNERLLVISDSTGENVMKFTLSPNGILTDINTYALYKIKD
jgi:hypothetical protein